MAAAAEIQRQSQISPEQTWRRIRQVAAIGATALTLAASAGPATNQAEASIQPPVDPPKPTKPVDLPPSVTVIFMTENGMAREKVSSIAKGNVHILSNISAKPLPRRIHRRLERQGKCRTFDGRKYTIWTKGWVSPQMKGKYGRDFRKSRFCRYKGGWTRVKCINDAFIETPPPPKKRLKGRVIFVKNVDKVKFRTPLLESKAQAQCHEGGSQASGYGYASARIRGSLKMLLKSKGRIVAKRYNRIMHQAYTEAAADAKCSSTEKTVIITQPGHNPKPEAPNNPPKGEMKPPRHLYSGGIGKICVDNIYDKDGDPVQAHDFRVYQAGDPHKQGIGAFTGPVRAEAGGAQCQEYQAPYVVKDTYLEASAKLSDGKSSSEVAPVGFPVLSDDFGAFALSRVAANSRSSSR